MAACRREDTAQPFFFQNSITMIKIYNRIIPFSGYKMMTLWPILFISKNACEKGLIRPADMTHEEIHSYQQREMLLTGIAFSALLACIGCGWWSFFALPMFLYWYGIEWLIRAIVYGSTDLAYKNISFEREAYFNQHDNSYVATRRLFAFLMYLKM